ncbi:hypothetical protein EBU94_05450 [bacterium]|nr:hypothetical protein [bacterium]
MIFKFNELRGEENQSLKLRYWAFDWDDNILNMSTKILMDQKVGGSWKPIEVSTAHFAEIRTDTENYRIRNGNPSEAFSEFRDTGPRGNSAFLEDVKFAISENDLGPSFDKFLKCLSEGGIFSIITARGHEPESIRRGVEFIIDEILTKEEGSIGGMSMADEMFQNIKKFKYFFSKGDTSVYRLGSKPSSNPLVKEYLDHCDFFGVSSDSFAKNFSGGSVQSPEESKKKALIYSINKCFEYAKELESKMMRKVKVTFGMSDDDPRTSQHIKDLFHEITQGEEELIEYITLHYYQTTDPQNVVKTSFVKEELSHQAWGTESSIIPFTKWNNMTQRLYPNTKDRPTDDYHNQMKNNLGQLNDLSKMDKRKKKNLKNEVRKKIRKFRNVKRRNDQSSL